jgi:hypothetical protein
LAKKTVNKYLFILYWIFPVLIFSQESDSLRIDYNYINSIPQNADLYINGIFAGQTPFHFKTDTTAALLNITIKLYGYADISYIPGKDEKKINKTFKMIPVIKGIKNETVQKDISTSFKNPVKILPMFISSVITAGSAALAYYYKSLSIEKNDEYEQTGDPAALENKKKYDVIGGVSLIVFQLAFAALIYFHFMNN